ncbi:MAG: hypothetical protein K2K38_06580 [Clostridia bacterium]|nr:hypothetical protein [Clostridia bacterium]
MEPYIYIIIAVVISVIVGVCFALLFRRSMKKPHPISKYVYIGMTEEEMEETCGTPEKTLIIDENAKVVSYIRWKYILLFWRTKEELRITIKNGLISNITQ